MTSSPPPAVVDAHAHIWPRGLVHPSQRAVEPLAAEPSDLLAAARAAAVDLVVVLPASIHEDNDFVLEAVARSLGRLHAIVLIDPWIPGAAGELARRAGQGAIGVRVAPRAVVGRFAADAGPLGALLDVAADLGLVAQWTLPLDRVDPIEFAAARRPDLRQILDHMGLPSDAADLGGLARIRALAALPGLYLKLSGFYALSRVAYPYPDTWAWAEGVVQAFGPARTLWASDWPLSTESADYAAQQALVGRLPFLDAASRVAVLSATARRLWGLPGG